MLYIFSFHLSQEMFSFSAKTLFNVNYLHAEAATGGFM